MTRILTLMALAWLAAPWNVSAGDWLHWRGPEQNGVSRDTGLPDKWDPKTGENVLWSAPYGGRAAPIISKGRLYVINPCGEGITEQERVVCLDANTGKLLWEHRFRVFLTDIVTNRVGWANLTADEETGYVYAHGTQGFLLCLDPSGKVVWQRSLTEEHGRITGYGGRVTSPIIDGDLLIIHMLCANWGNQGRGGHRFFAFNKKSGEHVWWSEPGGQPLDTMYSIPVVAVINGERLLICGGADGAMHAMRVRTGEKVWSYYYSKRGIDSSPVVAGNLVYAIHGMENLDNNLIGAVLCLDAGKITDGQPALVWRRDLISCKNTAPIYDQGRLYVNDDTGEFYCLDAATGNTLWRIKYGTIGRGSGVLVDGKIYVAEVASGFHILKPGDNDCVKLHSVMFPPGPKGEVLEINGSPSVSNGRLYFSTNDATYCLADKSGRGKVGSPLLPTNQERKLAAGDKPGHLQVVPAEVVLHPGQSAAFRAYLYNQHGQLLREVKPSELEWSLPLPVVPPPKPPAKPGPQPPALRGEITSDGKLTVDPKVPAQSAYVQAKLGDLQALVRVRVAPVLPYGTDFNAIPLGGLPAGWVNVAGKFTVVDINGDKALKKLADNPNPLLARAYAYIGLADLKDYTIEADIMCNLKRRNLPDFGVLNARYTLVIDGNKQRVELRSWEANKRLVERIEYPDGTWKPDVWYRFKLKVSMQDGKALCQGKIWPRDEKEPEKWLIEVEDPIGGSDGAPALYAFSTGITAISAGAETFFDNVRVYPNK